MESEQPWESTGIVRPSRPRVLREHLRVGWGGGGCFSFGVQTSGEYISTMFGCI